jgi:hypothetical protein
MRDTGCVIRDSRIKDIGYQIRDTRCVIRDAGLDHGIKLVTLFL